MLSFYLKKIFRNKYLKTAIVFVAVGAVFSLIYLNRIALLNFFDHTFHGDLYDVPSTYAHKKQGFEESPRVAQRLVSKGLTKLSKYASSLYKTSSPKLILNKNSSLQNNWNKLMHPDALTAVDMLFSDMSLFCAPVFTPTTVQEEWQTQEKLKKRNRTANVKSGTLAAYALTPENYKQVRNYLLELDQNYFESALQKKPDTQAAVSFRSDLFTALCLPTQSPQFWLRASDYMEYKTEQELVQRQPTLKNHPDQIYFHRQKELQNNEQYLLYLKNFFSYAGRYTNNLDWKLEHIWNAYLFTHDKYYFKNYLTATLDKLKISSKEEHCKTFQKLYGVDYKGIEKEFLYTYTLGVAAYGCGEYAKAQSIVNHIIKQKFYKEENEYQLAKHLHFLLQLQ